MTPARDRQVVRHLPDVMSEASGKALACAILGNPDRAKSHQAQLLTWNKEHVGLHVKQRPAVLVAIGAVKTEARCIQDSGRENPRFAQGDILVFRLAVHSKSWILRRTAQDRP